MAEEKFGRHIVKCPPEYSICTGCASCEIACALVHEGAVSRQYNRIFFQYGRVNMLIHDVFTCQQCEDHPCYDACPKKGQAMRIHDDGTVYIDEASCVGCGLCQKKCKYTPSRINMYKDKDRKKWKAKKCDLCYGRPEGPACVEACMACCLAVSGTEPWIDREKTEERNETGTRSWESVANQEKD